MVSDSMIFWDIQFNIHTSCMQLLLIYILTWWFNIHLNFLYSFINFSIVKGVVYTFNYTGLTMKDDTSETTVKQNYIQFLYKSQ